MNKKKILTLVSAILLIGVVAVVAQLQYQASSNVKTSIVETMSAGPIHVEIIKDLPTNLYPWKEYSLEVNFTNTDDTQDFDFYPRIGIFYWDACATPKMLYDITDEDVEITKIQVEKYDVNVGPSGYSGSQIGAFTLNYTYEEDRFQPPPYPPLDNNMTEVISKSAYNLPAADSVMGPTWVLNLHIKIMIQITADFGPWRIQVMAVVMSP